MTPMLPPSDPDAEWAVVSACVGQPKDSKLDHVIGAIEPKDFYDAGCRAVFSAIADLHENKMAVDKVSIRAWLTRKGTFGQVDFDDFQRGLLNVPWVRDVAPHIAQVRRLAKLRRFIETCHSLAAEGYGSAGNADEFLTRAEGDIYNATASKDSGRILRTLREAATSLFQRVQEENDAKQRGESITVETGIIGLDNILGPLRPGRLLVVAARPSIGKTALMLNIATHIAQHGVGVHVISLETDDENLAGRVIASNGEVNITRVMSGQLVGAEQTRAVSAIGRICKLPITIDDRSGLYLAQIRASIRRAAAELKRVDSSGKVTQKLGVVCLDYLQLAHAQVGKGNREQEVSAVAQGLLEMSKEFGVTVIALAQLNREIEGRKKKRPMMADIRESGAIEQAASIIIALYRESDDRGETQDVEAIVLKSKDSPIGTTTLKFRPEWMQFTQDMGGSSEY